MILYSPDSSPRIHYMANWLGNYFFSRPITLVHHTSELPPGVTVLNYSHEKLQQPAFQIKPCGLLSEKGIRDQKIAVVAGEMFPFFFATGGDHPFDIFSAIFYLISRYEEYLPHEKDEYGRYAHTNSLAFKNSFLKRPLVDEWMQALRAQLTNQFPSLSFSKRSYRYLPTYDVDIAWSYLNRGFARSAGGLLKNLLSGNAQLVKERLQTLSGKQEDPIDIFSDLDTLHQKFGLEPMYFFLLAEKYKAYDKNISPHNNSYQALIKRLATQYKHGIHLSWQAATIPSAMQVEKTLLESFTAQHVIANRMHYIRFDLPGTFEQLERLGIKEDYSMGYGSINGFRASTCSSFEWYNLAKEQTTTLTIFPYAYMEANSIFEQKDEPEAAVQELQHYHDLIKKLDGTFITIFHNHLIGRSKAGRKWWQVYEQFLTANF